MGVLWREELTPVSGDHRGLMKVLTCNNTTGHPGTATPKRLGRIRVIISSTVNHKCPAFEIAQLQPWRNIGLGVFSLLANVQPWQVTKMPGFIERAFVLPGIFWVVVSTAGPSRRCFSVFFYRAAVRVFMKVKAVNSGRETSEIRLNEYALIVSGECNRAYEIPAAFHAGFKHFHLKLWLCECLGSRQNQSSGRCDKG